MLNINSTIYIHQCYSLEYALNTYSHAFVVPKLESLWRDPMGPKWLPNPALLRAKGWPVKSRIRNEMDGVKNKDRKLRWWREDVDLIESRPKQTCGLCHASGHNCKKCPQSRGSSTSGHVPNKVGERWQKVLDWLNNCCSFYVYLMFTILSPNVISLCFSGMFPWMTFLLR